MGKLAGAATRIVCIPVDVVIWNVWIVAGAPLLGILVTTGVVIVVDVVADAATIGVADDFL